MNEVEIINLWKSYDKKLRESLLLNKKNVEDISKLKVKSFLSSMRPLKVFTVLTGIVWVIIMDFIIVNLFNVASPFFLTAAIIQVALTKIAIVIYLYQLILIQRVNINEPVLSAQHKIAELRTSTLWTARVLFLQLPVWTFFYWNKSMFESGNTALLFIQILITASFTALALWLFFNIRYENKDRKWFRLIFNGNEWEPVMKSADLLKQLDEYESENQS